LWSLIDSERISYFGTSAPFIMACRAQGLAPKTKLSLASLRAIGSTGAPLPAEGFHWIYDSVKRDVHLGSVSGGTDVCTAFLLSCPWLPVRAGELQCAALGAQVVAANEQGQAVVGELGELVIERPMPSMPLFFWNDPQGERLLASYFARFAGKWCHGDWLCQFEDGAAVVFGRSDATLNRGGVRMGSSEFYRVVEGLPFVRDSLVVDTSALDQPGKLWLFVVLNEHPTQQTEALGLIKSTVRQHLSPRHVPDVICFVPEIPYTLSGKKLEVPVKRLLSGTALGEVCNPGTLRNPEALSVLLAVANSQG
jgi:acetoacetyl-CoA synthetase